jgi:hypothetical protein
MMNGDGPETRQPLDDERDPVLARLTDLRRATERAEPRPGLAARIAARIDDRRFYRQTTLALATTGLLAVAGVLFWWRADADLARAIDAQITDAEGIEP